MTDRIRLLLADDHAHFRAGIRALLLTETEVEVTGEAATGEEAVERAMALQPDVVLMDVNMTGLNGIETTRRIIFSSPHIAVLVLSMFEDDDSVFAAVTAVFPELTDREREILGLLAQHRTNADIARRLALSEKTVRNYVSNIFAKLQVIDRAEAIIRAREAGLGHGQTDIDRLDG